MAAPPGTPSDRDSIAEPGEILVGKHRIERVLGGVFELTLLSRNGKEG